MTRGSVNKSAPMTEEPVSDGCWCDVARVYPSLLIVSLAFIRQALPWSVCFPPMACFVNPWSARGVRLILGGMSLC